MASPIAETGKKQSNQGGSRPPQVYELALSTVSILPVIYVAVQNKRLSEGLIGMGLKRQTAVLGADVALVVGGVVAFMNVVMWVGMGTLVYADELEIKEITNSPDERWALISHITMLFAVILLLYLPLDFGLAFGLGGMASGVLWSVWSDS